MRTKQSFTEIANKYNPVTKQWWTWVYALILTIVVIIDTTLKLTGGLRAWDDFIPAYIQFVALITGIWVIKLLNARDRKYFYFKSFANILWISNSIIFGFWISVIKDIILWMIDFNTYRIWGKDKESKEITKASLKEMMLFILMIAIVILAVGWPMTLIPEGSTFYSKHAWLDSINSGTLLAAVALTTLKRRESKLFFLLFAIGILIQSLAVNQLVATTSASIGIVISSLSMIQWYGEYNLKQKKQI